MGHKAAARPNAHQHISAIAAIALGLAVASRRPAIHREDPRASTKLRLRILGAFRCSAGGQALFTQGAGKWV